MDISKELQCFLGVSQLLYKCKYVCHKILIFNVLIKKKIKDLSLLKYVVTCENII